MRRIRIKGRFYVFLLILLAIIFLIVKPYLSFGEKVDVVMMASSEYTRTMDAAIIRDEESITIGSVARIEYAAAENTLVNEGDMVAYTYSTGYSESELTKLESVRENIQEYHKSLLANIIDTDLERLDLIVTQRALDFKRLVTNKAQGNLINVSRLLETAMVNRQEYMRSSMRSDLKLNNLYAQESARLGSISGWRNEAYANKAGVVSFYTDGYEPYLSADKISSLTVSDIRKVIAKTPLGEASVREKDICRIVNQDKWYVAVISDGAVWNPVTEQKYVMQFEGFEDISYEAYVTAVSQSDGAVLAIFEIDSPVGPMIYQRQAKVSVSITLTGLSVSNKAVIDQSGQKGVLVYDVPGGTFVPVTVLSVSGNTAIIEPLIDGALTIGQKILVK